MLPLLPSLVWLGLYRSAVRRREIGAALVRAHRAGGARLREIAAQLLAPLPEEDPRDFPVLAIISGGGGDGDGDAELVVPAADEAAAGQAAQKGQGESPPQRKGARKTLAAARLERKQQAIDRALHEKAEWRRPRGSVSRAAATRRGGGAPSSSLAPPRTPAAAASSLSRPRRLSIGRSESEPLLEQRDDELLLGALLGGAAVVQIASPIPVGQEETAGERTAAAKRLADAGGGGTGPRRVAEGALGAGSESNRGERASTNGLRRVSELRLITAANASPGAGGEPGYGAAAAESSSDPAAVAPPPAAALGITAGEIVKSLFSHHAPVGGAAAGRRQSRGGRASSASVGAGDDDNDEGDDAMFGLLAAHPLARPPPAAATRGAGGRLARALSLGAAERLPRLLVTDADSLLERRMATASRFARLEDDQQLDDWISGGGADDDVAAAFSSSPLLSSAAQQLRSQYANSCVVSVICTVFFMWTIVSTSTLELFSCISVDEDSPRSRFRGKFLIRDTSQRCFQGAHLRYMLGVGVPGLLLVCLAVPMFVIVSTIKLKREGRISHPDTVARFGFIFYGFTERALWWCALLSSLPRRHSHTASVANADAPHVASAQGVRGDAAQDVHHRHHGVRRGRRRPDGAAAAAGALRHPRRLAAAADALPPARQRGAVQARFAALCEGAVACPAAAQNDPTDCDAKCLTRRLPSVAQARGSGPRLLRHLRLLRELLLQPHR